MHAMRTCARNTPKILVSFPVFVWLLLEALIDLLAGIKEVVTLTSDLSRKNLEKDFERMDTPQGTFYRKSSLILGLAIGMDVYDSLQVSTLTFYWPSTARNSTPSSSAKVKSWAAVPLASGKRIRHAHNGNMATATRGYRGMEWMEEGSAAESVTRS